MKWSVGTSVRLRLRTKSNTRLRVWETYPTLRVDRVVFCACSFTNLELLGLLTTMQDMKSLYLVVSGKLEGKVSGINILILILPPRFLEVLKHSPLLNTCFPVPLHSSRANKFSRSFSPSGWSPKIRSF